MRMNNRAQTTEVIAAAAMIVLTLVGGVMMFTEGEKVYVGDTQTKMVYEYTQCRQTLDKLPEGDKRVFLSLRQATSSGYELSEDCA